MEKMSERLSSTEANSDSQARTKGQLTHSEGDGAGDKHQPEATRAITQSTPTPAPAGMTRAQAGEILTKKINTKNPSAKELQQLREAMKLLPEVARTVGDLAGQAREQIIGAMSANEVVRESIRQRLDQVYGELGYKEKEAPAVDRLLVEQVGICWLQMYQMELQYNSARTGGGSMSIDQAAWLERRLTMVQSRYLKAIETLVRVRRMGRATAVQVNIGGQQVNQVNMLQPGASRAASVAAGDPIE